MAVLAPLVPSALDPDADPAAANSEAASAAPEFMDEAAFGAFYAETAPKLRGYIRRSCGDAALADDLLQDAYFRFLRAKLPRGEPAQLRAYLYRIATSLLTDHWRRAQRERRWNLLNFRGQGEPSAEAGASHDESGTMRIFRQMKPRDRALLWLAYVEGFDHREIAAALGLRETGVRVLLFRARKKLGEELRNQGLAPSGAEP